MSAIRHTIRATLAAIFSFAAVAALALPGWAADCPNGEVVKGAAAAFISAARSNSVSGFGAGLDRYANVEELAMFALGKYRSRLKPEKRAAYVAGARRYMVLFLADNADRFKGASLTVESCSGDLVKTSLSGSSQMTWRLGGGKIKDVQVSGIWLALQLRQNFGNVMKRVRGDVGELIDYLSAKGGETRGKKN